MSETREDRLIRLFLAARGLSVGEREPFIVREAADDASLAAEVLSLLRHDSPTEDHIALHARAAAVDLARSDSEGLAAALGGESPCSGDALPERVGRYSVLRSLGRGGYGRVFLAEQDSPQRLVALKIAHAQASPTDRRRFRAEGEALARLQHPGIAQVYDAGVWRECGDRPYLVMEYIEGLALDDYAAAHALPRRRRLELLAQVCDAVAHAHRRGVIHRDLAPKNIMVGADGAPRVLDFGVARLLTSGGVSDTLSRDGVSLVGTLGYMSPEQLSGDPLQIDTRTDVYALGVIAYELLTGRRYLDVSDLTLTAALEAARNAPPARGSAVDRSLRGDLDAIVLKATERDVERRYPSASALAADIRRWLKDEPIEARPPSAAYRARKFVRRRRTATAAAALLAVGLSGAAVYGVVARRAEREAHAAALNALDAVVSRVLGPLAPKIGSLEEREALLRVIDRDVRSIAARTPDDPAALRLFARHASAMGDIQMERAMLGLGTLARTAAVDAYERLHALAPDDASLGHERSLAIVRLGDTLHLSGDLDAGLERFREALELDTRLAAKHPEDIPILSNLYWSYRRAHAWRLLPDDGANDALPAKCREVAAEMMRLGPTQWRSIEAAADAETLNSIEAAGAGDAERALSHRLRALELARRMASLDPNQKQGQALLLRSLLNVADLHNSLRRPEEAWTFLQEAETVAVGVTGPGADEYHRLVYGGAMHDSRAAIAAESGDIQSAIRWATLAVQSARDLRARYPGDMECHNTAAVRLRRLARLRLSADEQDALPPIAAELRTIAAYFDENFKSRPEGARMAAEWRSLAQRIDRSVDRSLRRGALPVSDRSGRMSDTDLAPWEILDDDGAGADEGVGADGHARPDEGVGPDPDIVPDRDRRPQQR